VARASDYLLIDISNSYAKFAFASKGELASPNRIATRALSSSVVAGFLRKRNVAKVIVSSVVPAKNSVISKAAYNKAQVVWLNWKLNLGLAIDYPKPQSIGADRLANVVAVAGLYGCPAVVVDFGTAATFDVVSEGRSYIGGVIAPGLEAMTNFLYERTALLPKLSMKEPQHTVGKSTIEAMRAGAVLGYRGLVREILARIGSEQKRYSRRDGWLCAAHRREIARNRRDRSAPDSRRITDRRELELIDEVRVANVCASGRSAPLPKQNFFPNQTENLRAERNFDLSGMLIEA